MRVGDLRHRVTLQYETRTADGMGGYASVWNDAAQVWAAIWPVSATETLQSAQQIGTITHRIRLRYRPDLKSTWRVKFGTRCFAIVSAINRNEQGVMWELVCREMAT